jgi:hypothetical protein
MPIARLTIKEMPGVAVMMEASGDYEPGEGGFAEELLMKAVAAVNEALSANEDMNGPEVIEGEKETVRKVYGDEMADSLGPREIKRKDKRKNGVEPGTILRIPSR